MGFLKKHYEKVLLGVVLAGLTVGAAILPWMIASERDAERAKADEIINRPIKPLDPLDLSRASNAVARAASPMILNLAADHKLFNPAPWQKLPDGNLKKVARAGATGVDALLFTKYTPLYTTITLDQVNTNSDPIRYLIGVEQAAAAKPAQRLKKQTTAVVNEKKELFTLREVKGPPENPAELILELTDPVERVSLARGKPVLRVDGYTADLQYPPESRPFPNRRVGDRIRLAGEDYNLVAISTNEVVLSAPSGKKTSRPFNPAP